MDITHSDHHIGQNEPKFVFSSKADVLEALSIYPDLHIPSCHSFTARAWQSDRQSVLNGIRNHFQGDNLAVRSSCRREDSDDTSAAGAFLSVLNVNPAQGAELEDAIDSVISSYGKAAPEDQVLVQPVIKNPSVTGVIMTRVLADGSPYYVINYDDESGKTDTITGGVNVSKTVFIYHGVRDGDFDSPRLKSFVKLARRLEEVCGRDALDIEFCLDTDNILHLLQARPICSQKNWPAQTGEIGDYIGHIQTFIGARTGKASSLFGQRSILGVMPDWNPAEMIGIYPHPLDSSLYRELITSRVWSSARARMGYRALPSTELMILCAGRPYIDVRASFNSFLPAGLDDITSGNLVNAWLERLAANPQLHDKVEFEIAQTVLDFCFDEHLDSRYPGLLTSGRRQAFRACLRDLTAACLEDSATSSINMALDRIIELRGRQAGRPLYKPQPGVPLSTINDLLSECRKYGTLPFSILARHGFIAESLMRTAVVRGAIAAERVAAFKRSIKTISSELSADFMNVCNGSRDAMSFLAKYGHLRPGSYDILSPRYADRENLFSYSQISAHKATGEAPFELDAVERKAINALLAEAGLPGNADDLLAYARKAIAGRELGKFVFSRNLSDVLEIIAHWASTMGLSREDASFLTIQAIMEKGYSMGTVGPARYFRDLADRLREEYDNARPLKLGYLIRSERDVFIVPQHRAAPNFIGNRGVAAPSARLYADSECGIELAGNIVCIENADPGFDWIFTRNIGGLVTKFGGTNSHMAIRCAEYGMPAAIGVGEQLFSTVANAPKIMLDPANAILKAVE